MIPTGLRLILRPYEPSDLEAMVVWNHDPETTRWMGARFRAPRSREAIQASLERVINEPVQDAICLAIASRDTGAYLGGIDLSSIDWTDRRGTLSMVLGQSADRRRGLGSEALGLFLDHLFGERGLRRVELNVFADNTAAVACYRRAGFREEGRRREVALVDGAWRDSLVMGLLDREWRAAAAEATEGGQAPPPSAIRRG
jgi:RimJ/RimL family protein N-acetyltransferase